MSMVAACKRAIKAALHKTAWTRRYEPNNKGLFSRIYCSLLLVSAKFVGCKLREARATINCVSLHFRSHLT